MPRSLDRARPRSSAAIALPQASTFVARRGQSAPGDAAGPVISFQPEGDIEETKRELEGKGVEFATEIFEHPWGRIATFKDSEGNDLQLYAPPREQG